MRRIIIFIVALALFMGMCFSLPLVYASSPSKITLTAANFTDENLAKYHDKNLIDEMFVLCDDDDKFSNEPNGDLPAVDTLSQVAWKPNFTDKLKQGVSGYIDLKNYYTITKIVLYDTNGSPTLTINHGKPFSWEHLTTQVMNKYKSYQVIETNVNTRFLQLSCPDNMVGICEIVLYGYKTSGTLADYAQLPRAKVKTTADMAFGVNAFVDDPLHVSKVGGHIREFHNITFTYSGKNYFSPSANGAWDFDDYYASLFKKGIDVVPCIQGTTQGISGTNIVDYTGNEKPIPEGADPALPSSYAQHSSVMFNYAARYGSEKVNSNRLNLAENQKAKTGLGYIKYYENFNEPNKDWEGDKSYFTAYEMAAMCSADYDGHEGELGSDYGIKNADKSAKLVMGGLVGRTVIEYISGMKVWFEHNRADKLFAVDVINLHYYVKTAVVESTTMYQDLKSIREWVDANLPGVEVWVTEFGPEISKEEIADPFSDEYYEQKAFATVRMFMAGYAAGIDRMTMFMLRDTEGGIYSTDGLTTQKGLWETKPSWHYMYGARNALKDTYFDSIIADKDIYIYRFKGGGKDVYALWTPGRNGETVENFSLSIGKMASAFETKLSPIHAEGITSRLSINKENVTVTVTNTPIFVSAHTVENPRIIKTKELIEIQDITGRAETLKKIQVLFDEQGTVPITPTSKLKGILKNYEQDEDYVATNPGVPEHRLYPISGILDLGRDYVVTDIGFYDSFSSGDIAVYAQDRFGIWQKIAEYGLSTFNYWIVLECENLLPSRYIKVERMNDATCFEMSLYGYAI